MIYTMSNGFHSTSANIRVEVGKLVSGATMRRAARKLCGMSDCTCGSSPASDAGEHQDTGVHGNPSIYLLPAWDCPNQARAAGWDGEDMDAMLCVENVTA